MNEQLYVSTCKQLMEEKLVTTDDNGDAYLTEKGKKAVAKILDRLSPGQEVMMQIAFAEHHEIRISMF